MPALFTVTFQLEAESLAEAESAVGSWVVTPGTVLMSVFGSVMSTSVPINMPDGGIVAEGELVRAGESPGIDSGVEQG
jgi:hypothetical protein